ncbi:MAG: dihydroorotase [Propionibacteriaceae bacterium]|uniref:Dihydroorotase n=1 Tax=Propionibacterium ruminifibrarum TaxID=1962131 RepID=A0A375HY56_9ACTN|nr:dihydroorotase [Propionibacterium ruminifibrarum]MBE6478094.1 dihydroorotase [Propionibacteriaceae bacterium]SPF67543.1 dihydroorotase [Propionibacterium ruminifibrarum]
MQLILRDVDVLGRGPRDLGIDGDTIADPDALGPGARSIDCAGLVALPALVDPHTHLRDPGKGDAETIATGLTAAAAGGFGAVFVMANTDPVADTAAVVEYERDTADGLGLCDLYPIGAVTKNLAGQELAAIEEMAASRAAVRMFSDDGMCVWRSDLMREALERISAVGGVLAQHSQDPALTVGAQLDEGELSRALGKTGWPAMAESTIIARDAIMAGYLGARLHVCHVSTASGVEVVRWAKQQGFQVTAEATPHHLSLDSGATASGDPDFKVNPPLRSTADVAAVREALLDGTIDMVGTDHAPHPETAKQCDWDRAANGMLGLETALSVVADLFVRTGRMSWAGLAEVMSTRPARLLGLDHLYGGDLSAGRPAALCLVDPQRPWQVDPAALSSIARNTPYKKRTYHSRVVATVLHGRPTFDLDNVFAPA